ncbi:B3 domain-containing protein isoform X2 [Capsicum chacoense]
MEACHDEKRVRCFFKVLIEALCFQVLYIPSTFARSVSHLTDQETYLEDSNGRRWRARVCKHDGRLAIKQGWPEFSSEHGLKLGNFVVFRYVPSSQHFIVQIFGTSGCEKIRFCSDKGEKVARAYSEATPPLLQTTSGKAESEKATDIDAGTGKGKAAICVDESFGMIDRDAQNDQEDGRLCLDLTSFELPASKPLAQGTSSCDNGKGKRRASTSSEEIRTSPLGPKDKKFKEASQFDSGGAPSSNADIVSCLVKVDGRDFLELPESWPKHFLERSKKGRMIIFLRGPDKRKWTAFYHSKSCFDVLTYGWKQFTEIYGLNPGDDCVFQLVNKPGCIVDVYKI